MIPLPNSDDLLRDAEQDYEQYGPAPTSERGQILLAWIRRAEFYKRALERLQGEVAARQEVK